MFRARPGTLILIRPDGYIAARTTDPQTITGHLAGILPA